MLDTTKKLEIIEFYKCNTMEECGKKFGYSSETIKRWMIRWGVKLRTRSEALKIAFNADTDKAKKMRKGRSERMKKMRESGIGGIKKGEKRSEEFKEKVRQTMKKKCDEGYRSGFAVNGIDTSGEKNGRWNGGSSNKYWHSKVIEKNGEECQE